MYQKETDMHLLALLLGLLTNIYCLFFAPVTSAAHVTDFHTLAQYFNYSVGLILGTLLIWVSILTRPKWLSSSNGLGKSEPTPSTHPILHGNDLTTVDDKALFMLRKDAYLKSSIWSQKRQ